MKTTDTSTPTPELTWHKSSYSGAEGGECVEVASGQQAIHVRDSKRADGSFLTLTPNSWTHFIDLAATSDH